MDTDKFRTVLARLLAVTEDLYPFLATPLPLGADLETEAKKIQADLDPAHVRAIFEGMNTLLASEGIQVLLASLAQALKMPKYLQPVQVGGEYQALFLRPVFVGEPEWYERHPDHASAIKYQCLIGIDGGVAVGTVCTCEARKLPVHAVDVAMQLFEVVYKIPQVANIRSVPQEAWENYERMGFVKWVEPTEDEKPGIEATL